MPVTSASGQGLDLKVLRCYIDSTAPICILTGLNNPGIAGNFVLLSDCFNFFVIIIVQIRFIAIFTFESTPLPLILLFLLSFGFSCLI